MFFLHADRICDYIHGLIMHSKSSSITYIFFVLFCCTVFAQQSEEDVTENNDLTGIEENIEDNSRNTTTKHFLDLTPAEREVLDEFLVRVGPNLTESYMESDEFLLRFLKSSKFDISSATSLLLDMLTWRKDNNIDNLSNEDYPEFEAEYVTYLEGCDRAGRPVISVPIGKWDIRAASLAGLGPRLRRFMDKIFEDATTFLRSVNDIGVELYQATLILDLDGFDMKTHGCPKCIQLYLYFFTTMQIHYPGFVEQIYFVNTPQIVQLIWGVYKDVFTPEIKAMSAIYMMQDIDWKAKLQQAIPPSSLSVRLGGNKVSPLELVYLRLGHTMVSALHDVDAIKLHNNCEKDLAMYETFIREMSVVMERRQNMLSKAKNELGGDTSSLGCKYNEEFLN